MTKDDIKKKLKKQSADKGSKIIEDLTGKRRVKHFMALDEEKAIVFKKSKPAASKKTIDQGKKDK